MIDPWQALDPIDQVDPWKKLKPLAQVDPWQKLNPLEPVETEEERHKRLLEQSLSWIPQGSLGGYETPIRAPLIGIGHTVLDALELAKDPSRLAEGAGNAISGIGHFLNPLNLPENVWGLVKGVGGQLKNLGEVALEALPGIDNLTPDEQEKKTWQAMADVGAWYFGAKAAKLFEGAVPSAQASKTLKYLTQLDSSTLLDEAAKMPLREAAFANLPKEVGAQLLRSQIPTGLVSNISRGVRGGFAGAAPFGFLYGDTPEERVGNAIQFGVISAAIGGVGGAIKTPKNAAKAASLDNLKQTLAESAAKRVAGSIPEDFAGVPQTTADLVEFIADKKRWGGQSQAVAVTRRLLKNSAPDKVAVVTDLPDIELPSEKVKGMVKKINDKGEVFYEEGTGYSSVVHKRADGSRIALVAPEDQVLALTNRQIVQFRQNGFYAGQTIEFGGKVVRIAEEKGAIRAGIATLEDGRKINLKDLTYSNNVPTTTPRPLGAINLDEASVDARLKDPNLTDAERGELYQRKMDLFQEAGNTPEGQKWFAEYEAWFRKEHNIPAPQEPPAVVSFLDAGLDDVDARRYNMIDKALTQFKERQLGKLADKATLQGYSLDYTSGKVQLIDNTTGKLAVEFDSPQEVQSYLHSIIQHPSGELVGLNPKISQELKDVKAPLPTPGKIDVLMARFNLSWLGRRMTEPYQYFNSLDVLHPELEGIFTKQFLKTQVAGRKAISALQPILKELEPAFKVIQASKNIDATKLTDMLEAVSWDEAISSDPKLRLLKGRNVNETEMLVTKAFLSRVTTPESLSKVSATIYETLQKALDAKLGSPEEVMALYSKLAPSRLSSSEIEAGRLILDSRYRYAGKFDQFSAYVPLQLAEIKLKNMVSKAELAKRLNLSPEEIAAVEGVRTWLDRTGTKFGIPEEAKLNHYFPRTYVEQYPNAVPDKLKAVYEDPAFDHALHRLGVRGDAYIKDAAYALHSYAHKGIRKEVLTPAIKEFEKEVIGKLNSGTFAVTDKFGRQTNAGRAFSDLARTYINEFQHFGSPDDMAATHIVQQMAKQYGVDGTKFQKWADRFVGVSSFATMGGNPIMGLRDFVSMIQMLEFRLGAKAIKEIFDIDSQLTNPANTQKLVQILREGGDIPPKLQRWYYHNLDTPVEGFTSQVGKIKNTVGDVAFQLTAQEHVYEKMHRAVFNWSESKFTKALNSFMEHKDQAKFFKEINLTAHDFGIQQAFKQEFDAGNFSEAGKTLSRAWAWEALGTYGLANYPIGWGSAWGRVFGQFGKWPLWAVRQLGSLASRPEGAAEAAKLAARWTGATAGLYLLGAGTGINFSSWVMSPWQMIYTGGPAVDMASDLVQIVGGNDPAQKDLAWRQLLGPVIQINNALTGNDWTMRAFKKPYIPVPYSIWNILEASGAMQPSEMMQQTYWDNPGTTLAKAMGFSVAPWKSFGQNINTAAENAPNSPAQSLMARWQ